VWAATQARDLLHFDGATWTSSPIPIDGTIKGLAAPARDDIYVISDRAAVHFDGTQWSPLDLGLTIHSNVFDVHARRGSVRCVDRRGYGDKRTAPVSDDHQAVGLPRE